MHLPLYKIYNGTMDTRYKVVSGSYTAVTTIPVKKSSRVFGLRTYSFLGDVFTPIRESEGYVLFDVHGIQYWFPTECLQKLEHLSGDSHMNSFHMNHLSPGQSIQYTSTPLHFGSLDDIDDESVLLQKNDVLQVLCVNMKSGVLQLKRGDGAQLQIPSCALAFFQVYTLNLVNLRPLSLLK